MLSILKTVILEPFPWYPGFQRSRLNGMFSLPEKTLGDDLNSAMGMQCCLNHKRKHFVSLLLLTIASLLIMILYLCPLRLCNMLPTPQRRDQLTSNTRGETDSDSTRRDLFGKILSAKIDVQSFPFDMNGEDVFVFLHMQKTGGSVFGKHLVKDLQGNPCDCRRPKKRCVCSRPNSKGLWIFSRYSLGWPCGLHADWTELRDCVPEYMNRAEGENRRRLLYITIIREPVRRFLSEYLCNQRGATWSTAKHTCNGRSPSEEELPPCYAGEDWKDVTMESFLACSSNLARNRQTRMLADLSLVNCYNTTGMSRRERNSIMLDSAKRNLEKMAYFALLEYQDESQFLFEKTFDLKFSRSFEQNDEGYANYAMEDVTKYLDRVKAQNDLDMDLYAFAKDLFLKRVNYFKTI